MTANVDVIEALLDNWLTNHPLTSQEQVLQTLEVNEDSFTNSTPLPPQSVLVPKVQLHSLCEENDDIFLVCGTVLKRLFSFFVERGNSCGCGKKYDPATIKIARVTKHNHCVKVEVMCRDKHITEWFSSSIMSSLSAGKYYVNVRIVHGFTSAGLLASQYESFCQAAKLGNVNEHYISDVYQNMKCMEAVEGLTEFERLGIIEEIKQSEKYLQDGEGVMIDARYDSVRTAYHTSVTAISMTNHKVIAIPNCSRAEIASASSREKPMTLSLIDNLQEAC